MEKFAGYGFNKSHSAAYALLAYQTAYLKAHYPAAFMAAVLSADMDNTDKVVTLKDECDRMGLEVLAARCQRLGTRSRSRTTTHPLRPRRDQGRRQPDGANCRRDAAAASRRAAAVEAGQEDLFGCAGEPASGRVQRAGFQPDWGEAKTRRRARDVSASISAVTPIDQFEPISRFVSSSHRRPAQRTPAGAGRRYRWSRHAEARSPAIVTGCASAAPASRSNSTIAPGPSKWAFSTKFL
jgi:hypothetical protein